MWRARLARKQLLQIAQRVLMAISYIQVVLFAHKLALLNITRLVLQTIFARHAYHHATPALAQLPALLAMA
jgi:hypothetical protein